MADLVAPLAPIHPDTLLSVTALARFEFEPGKGNDGTKVLMVEWEDDDKTRHKTGSWHVSWSGKRTFFPADDKPSDSIRRVYFLVPPGERIPPHVTLAYTPPAEPSPPDDQPLLSMTVNPLPAIFTPELGATAKTSGKKGVLHTIWAKRRLQSLEKEIKCEEQLNPEGVALEMARSEKEWIENHFGVQPKPPPLDLAAIPPSLSGSTSPGIQSPKSPSGTRLSEKLKGLSLGTSDKDLARTGVNTITRDVHPLSPDTSDLAFSSFSSFHSGPVSPKSASGRRIVAKAPPEYIKQQQTQSPTSSMDFISQQSVSDTTDDDLFAVALSPRSPEDPKSPFSISSAEAGAFAKIKGDR